MVNTQNQTFKLPEDLEGMVKSAIHAENLKKYSQADVDMNLRESARAFYGSLLSHGLRSVDLGQLKVAAPHVVESMLSDGEGEIYTLLRHKLNNDAFNSAKKFYMAQLDEDHKVQFYLDMVNNGFVPGKPDDSASKEDKERHQALEKVSKELALADAIENNVRKEKYNRAAGLVGDNLTQYSGSLLETYRALNADQAQANLYNTIAAARRMEAEKLMKENKLSDLVEKAIDHKEHGKAYALVGMYKAYEKQQRESKSKEAA